MNVNGTTYRTIWIDDNSQNAARLLVIDQRVLPHEFCIRHLPDHAAVCRAARVMAQTIADKDAADRLTRAGPHLPGKHPGAQPGL